MFCLTGNNRPRVDLPEAGYGYFVPHLEVEKFPDRLGEPKHSGGRVPFADGALTDGGDGCVEWSWTHLRGGGVEVIFDLGRECLVEKVVVRHRTSPSAFSNYRDPHTSGRGIGSLEIRLLDGGSPVGDGCVCRRSAEGRASLPETVEVTDLGRRARRVSLRLTGRVCLALEQVEIWGTPLTPTIYPTPQELSYGPAGAFAISSRTRIYLPRKACEAGAHAAEVLSAGIARRTGVRPKIGPADLPRHCLAMASRPPKGKFPAIGARHAEAYALAVTPKLVAARATTDRGLLWAAASILDALTASAGGPCVAPVNVRDWPDVDVRALHLFLPAERDIGFYLRWLEYLGLSLKYNTLFLELGSGMLFDRHPELYPAQQEAFAWAAADPLRRGAGPMHGGVAGRKALTGERVVEIVDFARGVGLEVIPEVQTLSHAGWYLCAHHELAEIPSDPVPFDHCPSNPATFELVLDLVDEVIEKLRPAGIHIGHDEVRTFGACPKCRGRPAAELFADDVKRMHGFLTARGIRTYMWSDHLIRTHNGQFHGTHPAAEMIPKDIVLLNWTPRSHLGAVDEQVDLGFEEYTAGGYGSLFRDKPLVRERGGRPYRKGYVLTTWTAPTALDMGVRGSLTDFVYCSETLWSQSSPAFEGALFWAKVHDEVRRMRREVLEEAAPVGAAAPVKLPPWPVLPDGLEPPDIPRRIRSAGQVVFRTDGRCGLAVEHPARRGAVFPPETEPVPIGRRVTGLAFLITGLGAGRGQVGSFVVRYARGKEVEVPLVYEFHVGDSGRYGAGRAADAHPLPGADLAWLGAAGGRPTALFALTWSNPQPDRPVESVRLRTGEAPTAAGVAWLGLTVLAEED